MPHIATSHRDVKSATDERGVTATLLEANGDLPPMLSNMLRCAPESFDDQRLGEIVVSIRNARDRRERVSSIRIAEHLKFLDASQFVSELANDCLTIDLAEMDAEKLWKGYQTRQIRKLCGETVTQLDARPEHADSIVSHLKSGLEDLALLQAPPVRAANLLDLPLPEKNDAAELLRHRYLCRGGGLLLCGPTGIGKSSFSTQAMILWSIGRAYFDIVPARPLRSLLIQAENDAGDLAEMRHGVCGGLNLSASELAQAHGNLLTIREDCRTSTRFFAEVVRPSLQEYRPDLLWIDPALAYLGGESNAQKDVGAFLRNGLNPLLTEFNCGCVVVHHTNKPATGTEKSKWQAGDFAYLGSGSAEWANWARAVLALRSIGSHDVFELHAAKRGSRLRWREPEGDSKAFVKHLAHSKMPGVICWLEAEEGDIKQGGRPKDYDESELFAVLPEEGLTTTEWAEEAAKECGIKQRRFYQLKKSLEKQKRVLKSKISNKWQPIKSA